MRPAVSARLCLAAVFALPGTAVLADPPRVVTDLPAVHALVSQVMGDLGTPVLLLDRGANAHSFQLRPSQAAALASADLLFWIGPEMTPWLARAMAGVEMRGEAVALLEAEGTFRRDYGDHGAHDHGAHDNGGHEHGGHGHGGHGHSHGAAEGHGHGHSHSHGHAHGESAAPTAGHGHDDDDDDDDHAHGHGHGGGHGHAHGHAHGESHAHAGQKAEGHGHSHGQGHAHGHDNDDDHDHSHEGTDPHAWLDPANAGTWLALIAQELAEHDAANAAAYAANAQAAAARIEALDARIAARLAPLRGKPFVVFHDAYGYFAGHYGLTVAGSIALGDAATPGAARLRAVQALLREGGVACAFPEAQHDPRLVETVVEGTGTRIGGTLDPSGSTLEPGPDLYDALLTGMAETIADCLEG